MPRFRRNRKMGTVPKKVKKYVKAEISRNIENKKYNFIIALTGANAMDDSTGVIFPLTAPSNGSAVNQRLGSQIKIKRIVTDWFVQMGAANPCQCRIVIVQDKQQQGTNPTLVNVFDSGGGGIGTVQAPQTPYNPYLTPTRFTVLHDWRFQLDQVSQERIVKRIVIPGSKISQVHFQSAGTLDGKGMLYALCFSDVNAAANTPRLICGARAEFEDA